MNHEERIRPGIKLNLKIQWLGQIYVIIVIHVYNKNITKSNTEVAGADKSNNANNANKSHFLKLHSIY